MRAEVPELPHGAGQLEDLIRGSGLHEPVKGDPDIDRFRLDAVEPIFGSRLEGLGGELFGEREKPGRVGLPSARLLALVLEPLPGKLADDLQHGHARFPCRVVTDREEVFVPQGADQIEHHG